MPLSLYHGAVFPLWDSLTPHFPIVWKDILRLSKIGKHFNMGLAFNICTSCEINLLQIKMDRWKYLVLLYTCAIYIVRSLLIILHLQPVFCQILGRGLSFVLDHEYQP